MAAAAATLLTEETVPAYLTKRASEIGVFPADADLTAKAIQGGNVNYAFMVSEAGTGKTIFVKQAPEFVAVFGPDGFPLTSARMQQEIDVYTKWRAILGPEDERRYLPAIYLFDKLNMVFVMEFLDGCTLLDHELVHGQKGDFVSPSVASGLGDFMGRTHAATHASVVGPKEAAKLAEDFENRPMRDVQLEFVFSKCYAESSAAAKLRDDPQFMAEIKALKDAYDGKGGPEGCVLSHGDLHPGSVMVDNAMGKVKVDKVA